MASNTPFIHKVFDTGGEIWATIPYLPLFESNKGFANRMFTQGAQSLFSSGGVLQEIPSGLPLRIYIEGSGGLAGVVTDPLVIGTGNPIEKEQSAAANTAIALSSTRIRTGTRTTWDTDYAFSMDNFPSIDITATTLHGIDPAQIARIRFAFDWVNEWALTLLRVFPFSPIILEGTIVGAGYSTAPSAGNSQKAQLFIQEVFGVAKNEWMGYEDIVNLGIPVLPLHNISTTNTDTFQRDIWNAISLITPLDTMSIRGLLFRPIRGISRERYVLYRTDVHPYLRKEVSA